ncbi:hypothetical protein QYF36_017050 [Acer negundo]|nr:hypothetical protein QYF36_017050 [Acer negundo]
MKSFSHANPPTLSPTPITEIKNSSCSPGFMDMVWHINGSRSSVSSTLFLERLLLPPSSLHGRFKQSSEFPSTLTLEDIKNPFNGNRAFQVLEREVQQLKALETAWYAARKLVQGEVKNGQALHFYILWYGA